MTDQLRGWRRVRVALAVAFALGTGTLCFTSCIYAQAGRATPVRLSIRTLKGDTVRIGVGAPVTLVAVFATWCRGCKEEVAVLNELQGEIAKLNVRLVALSGDETSNDHVQHWLDTYHAAYPVVRDTSGAAFRTLGVVGVPEIHLITGDGQEAYVHRGPVQPHLVALRSAIRAASSNNAR